MDSVLSELQVVLETSDDPAADELLQRLYDVKLDNDTEYRDFLGYFLPKSHSVPWHVVHRMLRVSKSALSMLMPLKRDDLYWQKRIEREFPDYATLASQNPYYIKRFRLRVPTYTANQVSDYYLMYQAGRKRDHAIMTGKMEQLGPTMATTDLGSVETDIAECFRPVDFTTDKLVYGNAVLVHNIRTREIQPTISKDTTKVQICKDGLISFVIQHPDNENFAQPAIPPEWILDEDEVDASPGFTNVQCIITPESLLNGFNPDFLVWLRSDALWGQTDPLSNTSSFGYLYNQQRYMAHFHFETPTPTCEIFLKQLYARWKSEVTHLYDFNTYQQPIISHLIRKHANICKDGYAYVDNQRIVWVGTYDFLQLPTPIYLLETYTLFTVVGDLGPSIGLAVILYVDDRFLVCLQKKPFDPYYYKSRLFTPCYYQNGWLINGNSIINLKKGIALLREEPKIVVNGRSVAATRDLTTIAETIVAKQSGHLSVYADTVVKYNDDNTFSLMQPNDTVLLASKCSRCQEPANFVCTKCDAPYCDDFCQRHDWREHKIYCSK
jgi:hypothetical protein